VSKRVDIRAVVSQTLPAVNNSYLLGYTFFVVGAGQVYLYLGCGLLMRKGFLNWFADSASED
jgi:hypothetical protein